MKRILPGCRNPGQPLQHSLGTQCCRIDRLWMQPTPFTTFERLTDGLGRCRAGDKQDEVGIERGCRFGANDFQRLAAFQVRLKAAYPPNRERLQAAWG